ncbi:hypothetical protein DASC09_055710 [Saccharomycopsis crataegensis]|uniref:NADP-dependent oxidoreductase domain-containing protein n=1 Tax=Saccharomycopsis crataegensis TaxID=43959 RepID=A0AAV5QTK9_9ASCO|nr:hypothetical protein DASC09_055710 [Saccharomycopsis crataegensis]
MTKLIKVSNGTVGFGTMNTTWAPATEAVEIFCTGYKAGCRLFNGCEFYGTGHLNLKYFQDFIDKWCPEGSTADQHY